MTYSDTTLATHAAPRSARGQQPVAHPANACGRCGATSYKPIIERGSDGVMRAAGRYACTGCKLQVATVADWKAAGASAAMPVAG